jgi:hypothetical protein
MPAPYLSHTARPYPTSRTYRQNAGALPPLVLYRNSNRSSDTAYHAITLLAVGQGL